MGAAVLEPLTPTPEQEQAIQQILASPTRSALVASSMGTGKTLQAVEVARRLNPRTVLITSPLNVRLHWMESIERQTRGTATISFIDRTAGGKRAWDALVAQRPGYYIIGRELFQRMPWSEVKHIDLVVHDECQRQANRKNKAHKVAMEVRRKTGFTICQSATWFGADFGQAWGIGRILFPATTSTSYWSWVYEYCKLVPDRFDPTGYRIEGELRPGSFAQSMPCYINLEAKASDPPLVQEIRVDLHPSQRRAYTQMEKKGIAWLESAPLVARVPGVIHARLRQITLGDVVVTGTGEVDPQTGLEIEEVDFAPDGKSAKFDALKEMLEDLPGEKVLIGTDSAKFARWVAARLPNSRAWTGDDSARDREAIKEQFIHGGLQYIVASTKALAEGVDGLQKVSHIIITLSDDYDPSMNTQFVGRINRKGQAKRVLVYKIVGVGTRDDKQAVTLLDKAIQMRESMLKEKVA